MIDGIDWNGHGRLCVSVPASTSNLGPGFDLCGLALSLFVRAELSVGTAGSGLKRIDGAGTVDWPAASGDKLFAALRRFADGDFEVRVASEIPVSRGLGSSAAAIVAGLLLGAAVSKEAVTRDELLSIALEIEGHPDNVAPALLGGCVLSVPRPGGAPCVVRQALHPSLAFAVAWPAARLETSFARGLLPPQVPFADAVENPRRLALLLEGLRSGDPELLRLGEHDRLHVPHRLRHVPGGERALSAAHEAGAWLATISGSGSALFAIAAHTKIATVAEAMRVELERESPPATARVVEAVAAAPRVERA